MDHSERKSKMPSSSFTKCFTSYWLNASVGRWLLVAYTPRMFLERWSKWTDEEEGNDIIVIRAEGFAMMHLCGAACVISLLCLWCWYWPLLVFSNYQYSWFSCKWLVSHNSDFWLWRSKRDKVVLFTNENDTTYRCLECQTLYDSVLTTNICLISILDQTETEYQQTTM